MPMDTTGEGRQVSDGGVSTEEIISGLNDLLQLDHDAIGAYEVAIKRLDNPEYVSQIQLFLGDHQRHVEELNQAIAVLGGTPENSPHLTGALKKALQAGAAPAGDKALLLAWRTNEAQVRAKYASYATRASTWPAHIKALVDRNALDEEHHHQWVVQKLADLGMGGGAGEMAFTARNRIADALDATAGRLEGVSEGGATNGSTARMRAARAASGVAHGLEGAAEMLREGDLHDIRTATERWARENPAQSIAITFAAGFLLGRLIR
jgi:ElaB/YqjD/DUF883 family membrane-anchored ribosome-binding protein/predicted outer membrane protein